ncbi:MAG: hypothetical protein ACRC7V_11120 [Lachnospiraceae bacterium]
MRKNIIKFIIVVSALLIFCFSIDHNFGRSYHHFITKSTDLTKENIENIYLNEEINTEKIISKYGKVSNFNQDNNLYNYYLLKEGIEIATNKEDNKIIRFIINDKKIKTEKGIKIGDKKDKIMELYGSDYYTRLEQGVNIIGYVDKTKKCSIEFWLANDDSILFYRLDYNFMQ